MVGKYETAEVVTYVPCEVGGVLFSSAILRRVESQPPGICRLYRVTFPCTSHRDFGASTRHARPFRTAEMPCCGLGTNASAALAGAVRASRGWWGIFLRLAIIPQGLHLLA
jgi:hypothetical protein